jgi:hypothetical protein
MSESRRVSVATKITMNASNEDLEIRKADLFNKITDKASEIAIEVISMFDNVEFILTPNIVTKVEKTNDTVYPFSQCVFLKCDFWFTYYFYVPIEATYIAKENHVPDSRHNEVVQHM